MAQGIRGDRWVCGELQRPWQISLHPRGQLLGPDENYYKPNNQLHADSPKLKNARLIVKVIFHAGRDVGESTSCPRFTCNSLSSFLVPSVRSAKKLSSMEYSQESNAPNGIAQKVSNISVSGQNFHVLDWCCGRRKPSEPPRGWGNCFLVEPIQIPAFPVFVPAHLGYGR